MTKTALKAADTPSDTVNGPNSPRRKLANVLWAMDQLEKGHTPHKGALSDQDRESWALDMPEYLKKAAAIEAGLQARGLVLCPSKAAPLS